MSLYSHFRFAPEIAFKLASPKPEQDISPTNRNEMESGTFDEVLGLEEQFYADGHQQGMSDGIKAGRIEGRTFGLEKGFEKYVEIGRLYGKSITWASRIPQFHSNPVTSTMTAQPQTTQDKIPSLDSMSPIPLKLPNLPSNARLSKHIKTLHALAESESLSTENTEEAVADFDDRCKRAQAKAKIIERMAGEMNEDLGNQAKSSGDGSIEDVSVLSARH